MNYSRTLSAARAAVVSMALGAISLPSHASLIITEFLADPASDSAGDANGDGTRSSYQDEFVELVNTAASALDISNWTLSDSTDVRHVFPASSLIPAGGSLVVFGGGTPTGIPGWVYTASSGRLSLNNGGDTISLMNAATLITSLTYGSEGGENEALTRDPFPTADFVPHSEIPGANGALFSPGSLATGMPYAAASDSTEPPAVSVPEPGTLALFAGGVIGLTVCGRRKTAAGA